MAANGAIQAAGILIGNGDIVSESLEITSQSEAIYYSGASLQAGLSDPGYSVAFVYNSNQLWAYIYGASGLEKQYCITQCTTSTSTTAPATTTTTTSTVAPGGGGGGGGGTTTTTTVAPGGGGGGGGGTTTTTAAPCGNYGCGFGFCDSCQGCVCDGGLCMCP